MAYGNTRFCELGKVLTKMALEPSRMVLCFPAWGAHGGNNYWRTLLDKLTLTSIQQPDDAIYVPLSRTPGRGAGSLNQAERVLRLEEEIGGEKAMLR